MSRQALPSIDKKIAQSVAYVCAVIIVFLPFHAVVTTWLGSNLGHLDLFRIWKEILIVGCIPPGVYLLAKSPSYKNWFKNAWLSRLIIAYIVLTVLLGLVALARQQVNGSALIYGLLANLRFLGFFLLVVLVGSWTDWLRQHWPQLVFGPSVVVVVFGLLQRFVLPYDFLKHFGYGPKTIPAYQTVDSKIDYRRIQSTLRGANPLGAYMVLVIAAVAAGWRKSKRWQIVTLLSCLVVLFLSYSRSAYLGAALAGAIIVFYSVRSTVWRQRLVIIGVCAVLLAIGGIGIFRHNPEVENTFFHTDSTSRSATSSNANRAKSLESGLHDVWHQPLGRGPGTAGPESTRNPRGTRIAENYFLQLGQEVGWLGLGLFIAINLLVGRELWLRREEPLALALLASLIGLTLVNLLSHAWSDDTLGLLWWGLAGIALSPAILVTRHKHEASQKTDQRS